MRDLISGVPSRLEASSIFDEAFHAVFDSDRHEQCPAVPAPANDAELERRLQRCERSSEADDLLTADLSFDQVYEKVLPHLTTLLEQVGRFG